MLPESMLKRLPITDPEYRYPTSRNPYWIKLREFKGTVYTDNEGETHKGKWREQFAAQGFSDTPAPLHVEIGCNGGHVILEWALANPQNRYIGIDWKFKPIYRAAEKARELGLKNIIFLRGHAERLHYLFGADEIDQLALYFPDPWQKKAQMKNRYITATRFLQISQLIRKNGIFHIKTDHSGYFDWMNEALREFSTENPETWETLQLTRNLHEGNPGARLLKQPEVTLFESIFIKKGLPINSLKLKKK